MTSNSFGDTAKTLQKVFNASATKGAAPEKSSTHFHISDRRNLTQRSGAQTPIFPDEWDAIYDPEF
jgi:hypothetical protein